MGPRCTLARPSSSPCSVRAAVTSTTCASYMRISQSTPTSPTVERPSSWNFLGEKLVRTINLLPGVTCEKSATVKDELIVKGADIDLTSRSAALIRQSCLVKD